jgi:hypothetical protein
MTENFCSVGHPEDAIDQYLAGCEEVKSPDYITDFFMDIWFGPGCAFQTTAAEFRTAVLFIG